MPFTVAFGGGTPGRGQGSALPLATRSGGSGRNATLGGDLETPGETLLKQFSGRTILWAEPRRDAGRGRMEQFGSIRWKDKEPPSPKQPAPPPVPVGWKFDDWAAI